MQVLEGPAAPRPLIQVGTLVADEQPAAWAGGRRFAYREAGAARQEGVEGGEGGETFPLFVVEVGMEILIRDARFWVALLLLIRAVLFYVVPAFPEQIWVAIDTFVGVVLGILAGNNVVQMRRARRRSDVRQLLRGSRARSSKPVGGGAPLAGTPPLGRGRAGCAWASPSHSIWPGDDPPVCRGDP